MNYGDPLFETLTRINNLYGQGEIRRIVGNYVYINLQFGAQFKPYRIDGDYVIFRGKRRKIKLQYSK